MALFHGVGMLRYSGKTAFAIRLALETGGTILVNRESGRQRILEVAKIMGVEAPRVVVAEKGAIAHGGTTYACAVVDIDIDAKAGE